MPLIRKKTSKRTTTHRRERIKHKIVEGNRKKRKQAKKNPQWKSKKKKDPGIPSNLPFKDEIIAEILEQRRQTQEDKKRRGEERIYLTELGDITQNDVADESSLATSSKSKSHLEEEAPLLWNPELPNMRAVIDKSHLVLNILDARDPLSFIISHIKELVSERPDARYAFILNKIEQVPKESAAAWLKYLRSINPTFAFRSASAFLPKPPVSSKKNKIPKGKAKESELDAWGSKPLLEYFNQCAVELKVQSLRVAIIGLTNVGKSSIVNSLTCKSAAVPVYECTASTQAGGTTTTRACEIELTSQGSQANYILVDTPGVSFQNGIQYTPDIKIRDMLTRRRGRVDKVKDPLPLIDWIVSKTSTQDLMLHYNLPAFSAGDSKAFVSGIARALNLVKKGGELDLNTAARSVLRDWNTGKLPIYTEPSASHLESSIVLSDSDESILIQLKGRKEMWKEIGLVKLESGEPEGRLVNLEAEFMVEEMVGKKGLHASAYVDGLNDDERAGEEDEEDAESHEEEDDDDEDDDDNEEEDTRPIVRKRKAIEPKRSKPSKKVAFAPGVADHVEKKAARKLQQQTKERQKAKPKASAPLESAANKSVTTKVKPKATSTKPPQRSNNKSSSKQSSASDSNAYDFDQFFRM